MPFLTRRTAGLKPFRSARPEKPPGAAAVPARREGRNIPNAAAAGSGDSRKNGRDKAAMPAYMQDMNSVRATYFWYFSSPLPAAERGCA